MDAPTRVRILSRARHVLEQESKPTVAQFCAFAILSDGRRVKTENSVNNPYCEQLFQDWVRQRVT